MSISSLIGPDIQLSGIIIILNLSFWKSVKTVLKSDNSNRTIHALLIKADNRNEFGGIIRM